jgi:hypothetical protein
MSIPFKTPANGGTIRATLQIVEPNGKIPKPYEVPKKIYAETKIDMTAHIDCHYEGC